MRSNTGAPFALSMFDAAEGFLLDPDYMDGTQGASLIGNTATHLEVVGNLSSGGTVDTTFTFDGVNDSIPGGLEDFQTFSLPTSFIDLVSVTFTAIDEGVYQAGTFSIDTLSVSTSSNVPEPGTALLFLFGFSIIWIRRIRNVRHLSGQ
jgi:hypothetical protein